MTEKLTREEARARLFNQVSPQERLVAAEARVAELTRVVELILPLAQGYRATDQAEADRRLMVARQALTAAQGEITSLRAGQITNAEQWRQKAFAAAARVAELTRVVEPFARVGELLSPEDGWSSTDELELLAPGALALLDRIKVRDFRAALTAAQGEDTNG